MEMDSMNTLQALEEILNTLEGVRVIDMTKHLDNPDIVLTINSQQSLLLLIYCSEAANIMFGSWAYYIPGSKEATKAPEDAIRYRYYATNDEKNDLKAIDFFKNLGAHLVWKLQEMGQIQINKGNNYLDIFNAGHRYGT